MRSHNDLQSLRADPKRARWTYLPLATIGLAALCSAGTASAEDHAFKLRAGAILADVDTKIRVDPTRLEGSGATLDFESDLGLPEKPDIGFVELSYRFSPRWTANFQYLTLSRDRLVSLDRDITVGDTVFPVDARVTGRFASNLYRAHVAWSFINNEKADVGLSLGAHVTDFTLAVEGEGNIGSVGGAGREERREVTAPLPNVGVFGTYEVIDRLTLSAKANYLQLKIDQLEGGLTDLEAGLSYQVTDNFAIGAGYRRLEYRLDAERKEFEGSVRYEFNGPFAFVQASF